MSVNTSIRVLIADDHTVVRQGLAALLGREPGITVCAEAADGREAVAMAITERPDVVVMDLAMDGMNGVDATAQIRRELPDTRVLVLSMHADEAYVRPAIRAGATGYLLKGSGVGDLVRAVRAVASGEAFFSPRVASLLLTPPTEDPLSPREREVLQLVAEGHSSASIAALLHLSARTVEGHRARIARKLGIGDVPGLVRYAIRQGLIRLDT